MTTLKLNIKVPEIYQNELSSNPAIVESGVTFSVSITETFLDFSETLVEKFGTYDYTVLSNVLQPDFTKMFSTTVTINSEKTDSPVLIINSIRLFNTENLSQLGSTDLGSVIVDNGNVIVIGDAVPGDAVNIIKPCATCINTDFIKSCCLYAKKNSEVQFLFSLTKITGKFYLVLQDYKGTVDCNFCIANFNKLKNFSSNQPQPNDCISSLSCRDSNSFAKLSQYVDNAKTCIANYIDSPNMETCLNNSGIFNATSCANCLSKNSSCGVPPCCNSTCSSNNDCIGATGGCTICANKKCTLISPAACDSACSSNTDCVNATGGCTTCANKKCTLISPAACGSACLSNNDCVNATGGCTTCDNKKCTLISPAACGSACSSNTDCVNATGGCNNCRDGKCDKQSQQSSSGKKIFYSLLVILLLCLLVFSIYYYETHFKAQNSA